MKLFKRKNDEDKLSYKIGNNIFGDSWKSEKERSGIILILWFIFILFIVIFINTSKPNKDNKLTYLEPSELIHNIIDNYNYDLTVYDKDKDIYIYYSGSISNGIDKGIKKANDIEINYQLINDIFYDENMNIIDNPYYPLSLDIFHYLNDYSSRYLDKKIMTYIYDINYNDSNIKVYLKTTYDKITLINYDYLNYSYTINILN